MLILELFIQLDTISFNHNKSYYLAMLRFYSTFFAIILFTLYHSSAVAYFSYDDCGIHSIDTLVTIDTTAMSKHILLVQEISRFEEVILKDTVAVDNSLQIKKITVEHTTVTTIDTIFLVEDKPIPTQKTIARTAAKDKTNIPKQLKKENNERKKTTIIPSNKYASTSSSNEEEIETNTQKESIHNSNSPPKYNTHSQSRFSSNYYLNNPNDLALEEPLIVAESTGEPLDLSPPIPSHFPPKKDRTSTKSTNIEVAPASRAGLPGAKVLERRVITPEEAYQLTLSEIEKMRQYYAKDYENADNQALKSQILKNAASYFEESIAVDVVHYWYGTSFDKEGMAKNPNEGKIACSYFITTVLEDAGLKLNRVKLAQQSAQNIAKTLCDKGKMKRLTTPTDAKSYVQKNGKGLYVIGFSYHVGFLYNDGTEIYLIHASPLPPGTVARLPMEGARSFDYSKFYDIGKISDNEELIKKWLKGEKVGISY